MEPLPTAVHAYQPPPRSESHADLRRTDGTHPHGNLEKDPGDAGTGG